MARVKTFINGGSLLPADLDTIQDDYEAAFKAFKHLLSVDARLDAPAAGTYVLTQGLMFGAGEPASGAKAALAAFYLDPADYLASAVNTRTTKYNVKALCLVNAVAPTVTYTVGLYPITKSEGAENSNSLTLGAVTAGSAVAFATPAKESLNQSASGSFTAPAAGYFALAVVVSGAAAAKSSVTIRANVALQQV